MSNVLEKTNIIRKDFLEEDVNHDELITLQDLYRALDRKSKKQFDRDVGQQLFERMTHDFNNRVSVDEFIKVWLQAEEILRTKIDSCKKYLQDYHFQRNEANTQLERVRQEERVNQYGVMEESKLTITLVNGFNFPHTQLYALVKVGEEKGETVAIDGPNPHWSQTFTFNINSGLEEIQLFFISPIHPSNPMLLGTVTISLSTLIHQTKKEEAFTLFNKEGIQTNQKINLSLQWIYSKVKYLHEIVERWNDNIKIQEDDLLDYERDLATLYEPFPSLIKVYQGLPPNELRPSQKKQPQNTYINTPVSNPTHQTSDLLYTARVGTAALLLLALICSFQKAQFLDLLISFLFIILFESQRLYKDYLLFLSTLFGFSSALDIFWLSKYSTNWWQLNYQVMDEGIIRTTVAMVYLSLLVKIILIITYFILAQKIGSMNINVPYQKQIIEDEPAGITLHQNHDLSNSTYEPKRRF